jgi:hypothetical protein
MFTDFGIIALFKAAESSVILLFSENILLLKHKSLSNNDHSVETKYPVYGDIGQRLMICSMQAGLKTSPVVISLQVWSKLYKFQRGITYFTLMKNYYRILDTIYTYMYICVCLSL